MSPRERTLRRMKQLGVAAASVASASTLAACPETENGIAIQPAENFSADASLDAQASKEAEIDSGAPVKAAGTLDASSDPVANDLDAGAKRKRMRDRDAGHSYAPRPPPSGYMVVDMLPPPANNRYKP